MSKPLLIYDGDCGFCRKWVDRWKRKTGDHVEYAPYQEVASQFPDIPLHLFQASVQLVEVGEGGERKVTGGAEAVFRVLQHGGMKLPLWCYRYLPGFRQVSEYVYRFVAAHRAKTTCATPRR